MGARLIVRTDGQTDVTKPTRALHYDRDEPKNYFVTKIFYAVKKHQSAFTPGIKQICKDV